MSSAAIREVNFRKTSAFPMSSAVNELWTKGAVRRKVVIVDDQAVYRAALCWTLLSVQPNADIVEAGRLSEAMTVLRGGSCDLVLLADTLPDSSIADAISAIKAQFSVEVAVVSSDPSRLAAHRALDCGASHYITKTATLETIKTALARLTGGSEMSRVVVLASIPAAAAAAGDNVLTPAQAKVLALVKEGQLNKQIAHEMGITESTVKAHVSAIFRKLKVQNRVQAIIAASNQHARALSAPARSFA